MNDTPTDQNTSHGTEPEKIPPPPKEVIIGTPKDKKPTPQESKRKGYSKLRKAPIWIEAACAIALIFITGFYTHYASKQATAATKAAQAAAENAATAASTLAEMKKGSTDTHELAVAAAKQATNTERLAIAARDQVTKLQAGVRESHALAKATQDIVAEQRPYMWAIADIPNFQEGQPLKWDIHFKNYGGSPAIHVSTCVVLVIGVDALSGATPSAFPSNCLIHGSDSISPPNYDTFTTAISREILSGDALKFIRDIDRNAAVIGFIKYQDASGHPYRSTFCYFHLATGAAANCEKYNEIQ